MTELEPIEGLEVRAGQALRTRDRALTLALARTLVARAPERPSGWLFEAATLILDDRAETVYRRLLPRRRQSLGCDGILFLKDVFLILAWNKAFDAILNAAAKAPSQELYAIIPTYFAACVLLARHRFEEGFALLGAFRSRCLANLAALPSDDGDGFMVLFRHALLVNDGSYLETPYYRENLATNRAKLGPLRWATSAPERGDDARPVVMVSCDQRYAQLFLPRFLASVEHWCQDRLVHVHLLDPDPAPPDPAALPALQRNRLALTWEECGALKCSAWYASARFVRIAALLEHYRRPILLFDVDVALLHPLDLIEAPLASADFGCFRMDRLDPGSVYQASVTAFQPTAAGQDLARLLGALILSKMSLRRPLLWLIDQASLYSAITLLSDQAGRLTVADFTRALGMTVEEYVEFCDRNAEKLHLMKLASGVILED